MKKELEDQIFKQLKHDKPGQLRMVLAQAHALTAKHFEPFGFIDMTPYEQAKLVVEVSKLIFNLYFAGRF